MYVIVIYLINNSYTFLVIELLYIQVYENGKSSINKKEWVLNYLLFKL